MKNMLIVDGKLTDHAIKKLQLDQTEVIMLNIKDGNVYKTSSLLNKGSTYGNLQRV